jgi:hypothetical protein
MSFQSLHVRDQEYCHYTKLLYRNQQLSVSGLRMKCPFQNVLGIVMSCLLARFQIERTLQLPSELQV